MNSSDSITTSIPQLTREFMGVWWKADTWCHLHLSFVPCSYTCPIVGIKITRGLELNSSGAVVNPSGKCQNRAGVGFEQVTAK